MEVKDALYVITSQLKSLNFIDPFNDEYYIIQTQKKDKLLAEDAKVEQQLSSTNDTIPIPLFKDTKEMVKKQEEETRRKLEEKQKSWVNQVQSLGTFTRYNVSEQRQLLSIVDDETKKSEDNSDEEQLYGSNSMTSFPFSGSVWKLRKSIDDIYTNVLEIEEMDYLLTTPAISGQSSRRQEILMDRKKSVNKLVGAMSILYKTKLIVTEGIDISRIPANVDVDSVSRLMAVSKGIRGISKGLPYLPSGYRAPLLPLLLNNVLQKNPPLPSSDEGKTEDTLLIVINRIMNDPNSDVTLPELTSCLEGIAKSFATSISMSLGNIIQQGSNGGMTLRSALASKNRAKVLQSLLMRGNNIISSGKPINDRDLRKFKEMQRNLEELLRTSG